MEREAILTNGEYLLPLSRTSKLAAGIRFRDEGEATMAFSEGLVACYQSNYVIRLRTRVDATAVTRMKEICHIDWYRARAALEDLLLAQDLRHLASRIESGALDPRRA